MDLSARLARHEPSRPVARIGLLATDADMATSTCMQLSGAGFASLCTPDERRFEAWVEAREIDAAVVTWPMGSFTALRCCDRIRQRRGGGDMPLVLVSQRVDPTSRICGLDAGADVFLSLPGEEADLLPRVGDLISLSRRRQGWLEVGALGINYDQRKIAASGRPVRLSYANFELLHFLMCHPGRVFSHQELADVIRGTGLGGSSLTIPGHIVTIRRELGASGTPDPILTVPGRGYLLVAATSRPTSIEDRSSKDCCFL